MKKILKVIKDKEIFANPPIWIMRQAGRYLPEYLEIRKDVKNFLDLCYNPKLASEVTLQPINRFDFDAAIIFSDILVIPDALGVKVEFLKNEGPKLGEFKLENLNIKNIENHLNPVFEAISLTKSKLNKDKALIGFCGAPWTLACYMIEGGGSKNFEKVKRFALERESEFQALIDILCESLVIYLSMQIKAGADLVKIFDSWASVLPPSQLQKWVINPTKKIILELKKLHPEIPVISFPRGIATSYPDFVAQVNCDCVALDQNIDRNFAVKNINCALQGNLDNFTLAFASKKEIEKEVIDILNKFSNNPFIFNLGHGILPQTPIENVELVLNLIRNYEK
jgi:uroporphyrinogen decarboxylase